MNYKNLENFQNDILIKEQIIKEFDFLEWILIWILWEKEKNKDYNNKDEFNEQKLNIYYSLYEIKESLQNQWLNISLVYNRLNIIIDNILDNIPLSDTQKWVEIQGYFFKLQYYLENILKDSWVDTYGINKQQKNFTKKVEKIIYSK